MPNINIIKPKDVISARMAECYVTINDRRYNFMQIIDAEFKIDKVKGTVARLGATMIGHKTYAMEGTFSGTMHYNQSVMRELLADFKSTGVDTYFEIQISNEDPASAAGRQTVTFYDCLADGGVLAKFDGDPDGESLDEPIEGTFDDFIISEDFTELEGFVAG